MNVALISFAFPVAIAGAIVILVAARRDADPDRRRTEARYLGAVCFLSVFVTLFGAYAVVAQLSSFVIDREQSDAFSFDEGQVVNPIPLPSGGGRASDDATWRGAVQAALLTAAATGVLMFHRGRRRDLRATPSFTDSAAARVDTAYLYVACFLAAFVVLVAATYGTYGIFRVVAPGVTGFDSDVERQKGIAQAISLAALGVGSYLVFLVHWRERPEREESAPLPTPVEMA
jgi:hypothetical protein